MIWVPIGVRVGTNPRLTQFVQPVAQFLAAFPANVLFPVAVSAIVVFKLNPDIWLSPLMEEIEVKFRRSARQVESDFRDLVERIYVTMTARCRRRRHRRSALCRGASTGAGIDLLLPRVSANTMSGLIEAVAGKPYDGKADLPVIASALQMEVDDLFPVAEALQVLRFAEIEGGDIRLTNAGKQFAEAGVDDRKKLFQRQL